MALFKEKKGFFGKLSERIGDVIMGRPEIDEDLMDELEEILITSDIGMDTTMKIMEQLRQDIKENYITKPEQIKEALAKVIAQLMDKGERNQLCGQTPLVILMIGINGGGKTTSIAKIGHKLRQEGKTVLLGAADTFRAAAGEQLAEWARRADVPMVGGSEGADPASVVFDAVNAAKARGVDVLLIDTAGRLHNKKNLMEELRKMNRIIDREYPDAHRENLIVLDGTTGQNAMIQAREFGQVAELTGIILTKMDGTAKGGIAVAIQSELGVPVKYIGVGETIEDLQKFDSDEFVNALFS